MTTFCHRRHHTHTPPSLSPRNGPPHWGLASTSWGDSLQTKTTTAETTLLLLILIPFPTQYDRATSAECSEGCTSSNHQSKNRSNKCRFRGKDGQSGTRKASHLDQGIFDGALRTPSTRPFGGSSFGEWFALGEIRMATLGRMRLNHPIPASPDRHPLKSRAIRPPPTVRGKVGTTFPHGA